MPGGHGELDFSPYVDPAGTAADLGAVERVQPPILRPYVPQADVLVEGLHLSPGPPLSHGTILLMGSSMMSDAPAPFRSGINLLIASLGTTVSTA